MELMIGSRAVRLSADMLDVIMHMHLMSEYDVKFERMGVNVVEMVKNERGTYDEFCDYRLRLCVNSDGYVVELSGDNVPMGIKELVCGYVESRYRTESMWELCDGLLAYLSGGII
jgi:hypothetical protein